MTIVTRPASGEDTKVKRSKIPPKINVLTIMPRIKFWLFNLPPLKIVYAKNEKEHRVF